MNQEAEANRFGFLNKLSLWKINDTRFHPLLWKRPCKK
jgi:hypothetical protein